MNQKTKAISDKKIIGIAGLAWMFDAMDVGLLSFLLVALQKDWNLTTEEMSWIGSINSIGMVVGAFIFGVMADKIGRKSVFIITLLLFSIGSGISAFVSSLAIFLLLRFLIGMGLGGELPVASTLVSEMVSSEKRGRVVVLLESFWAAGWILSALIAYFIIPEWGWRTALLLSALPAFYTLYLRFHLPDSPKYHQAKQVQKPSILDNMKGVWSAEHKRQTFVLWILWFSVVFSYYGMFLWLPSVMVMKGFSLIRSFEYVLIMTLAQLPGYFTAAYFIEKIGRKFVLVVYLIGTAASAYVFGNSDSTTLLLTSGIFLSFFNLGAWGALYAYTPEQYPTSIRGTGSGMASAFGRIGGVLGPLVVGYLVADDIPISVIFTIFTVSILIGVVVVQIWGKETKQTVLQD
ncbi:MFS transporter [Bacillus suaedaesalsae]|uniref:MFS transporter n=1 Tax=Bacillus suaedaesalsae TaxID=2810349 RepID=A0ABS2DF76_9BACI|nr:MFS transporter [Bacillus suaedaesalsae]MBM6617117.1 MFS transporter [Bacillus suaedaesalsae]